MWFSGNSPATIFDSFVGELLKKKNSYAVAALQLLKKKVLCMPFIRCLGVQFMQEWKRLLELQYSPYKYKFSLFYVASLTTIKSHLIIICLPLFPHYFCWISFPFLMVKVDIGPSRDTMSAIRAWALILILTPTHWLLEQRCPWNVANILFWILEKLYHWRQPIWN